MFENVAFLHDGAAQRHTIGPPSPAPSETALIRILRAKSLAHCDLTPDQRAQLGADWVDYRLLPLPTVELASSVFHVSTQGIRRARRQQPRQQSLALGLLAAGWAKSTEAEHDAFVSANLLTVWDAIDRVTR